MAAGNSTGAKRAKPQKYEYDARRYVAFSDEELARQGKGAPATPVADPVVAGLKLPDGDERAALAWEAAAELERCFGALITQSDFDYQGAHEPRSLAPAVLFAVAQRGRTLASAIIDAIGDDGVATDELRDRLGRRREAEGSPS